MIWLNIALVILVLGVPWWAASRPRQPRPKTTHTLLSPGGSEERILLK